MTGTVTGLFTHKQSRSYLNHLVIPSTKESRNIMKVELKTVIDSKFEIHVTERLIGAL